MKYRLLEIWRQYEHDHNETISYRQLARRAHLSLSTIQRVENNENVSMEVLQKLAQVFHVRVKDLIDE
jgi:transcriptional regulator with XRE-family HTH domain